MVNLHSFLKADAPFYNPLFNTKGFSMTFGHGFWIITGVYFLACMSPGPDFVLVSQQVLSRGRAAGMLTALGIALGFGIHIIYSVLGLVTLVAQSTPASDRGQNRRPPVSAVYRL